MEQIQQIQIQIWKQVPGHPAGWSNVEIHRWRKTFQTRIQLLRRNKKGDKLLPFLSWYRYPSIPGNTYQVVSGFGICWYAYDIYAYKQGSGEYPPNGRPTPIMRSLSTETDQCGGVRYSHHKHSKFLIFWLKLRGSQIDFHAKEGNFSK